MTDKPSVEEQWRMLLAEGRATKDRERLARLYGLIPSSRRCRICRAPFAGIPGQIMASLGKTSSNLNPHLCSACDSFARANPGGVELRLSMLFADIRGSTSLAERMTATEFRHIIDRFFATGTEVLCRFDALMDKLAGDQVSGYFVPGLAGPKHAQAAVRAAQELLRATGYEDPSGPWIPVGIGVHTGQAFIGALGVQGGIVDVTALGDAVNVAARLASNAKAGEILLSEETYAEAELALEPLEQRELALKGRTQPVKVHVLLV